MFTISPISKYRCHFLQIGFIAITLLTTSLISLEAHAEKNKRVCVSQGGKYAIKINKGFIQKSLCENGHGANDSWRSGVSYERLGQAKQEEYGDFGRGIYKTCEEFSTTDLGWGGDDEVVVDPCPAMNYAGGMGFHQMWKPGIRDVYFVGLIPFSEKIIKGTPCGGSGCSLGYTFSTTKSISYTAGSGFSAGPISGSVSFTHGTSTTWGASRSDNWGAGHTPGLSLNATDLNADRENFRTFNDLELNQLANYKVHTKGWSTSEREYRKTERKSCYSYGTQTNHADYDDEDTIGVMMDPGVAKGVFETRNLQIDDSYGPERLITGGCGVYLKPAWPQNEWRSTDDMNGVMLWVVIEDEGFYIPAN
ncbi:MAG: hypothetical protein AB8B97_16625 [Granulosicoccus sp.]